MLLYRETGLPLAGIGRLLDDPGASNRDQLNRQREQLSENIDRPRSMARTTDQLISADISGLRLIPRQQTDILGAHWRPDRTPEAEKRWSDTEQWARYLRRTADRGAAECREIVAETEQLNADLAAALRAGARPGSAPANALAERHRALLARHFDRTHALHVCVAQQYAEEPGYAEYYDRVAPGLSDWLIAVIRVNAESRQGRSSQPVPPADSGGS